jgi:digeranylgeranylglycerophospholipid reductase
VDVLVIGAGPAGLSVARTTAAAGLETIVVERQAAVAEHVRTSGATAVETVRRLGAPRSLYHIVDRVRIASPRSSATLAGDELLCILDVRGFYRWLAASAEGAGARMLVGATAREPIVEQGAVAGCVVAEQRVRARIVVDAGGHRAQVSKRVGLYPGFSRFGVGAEYELEAPDADQREAVLIVGDRYAPAGYAWSFPWGGERVRVGVGIHHADVRDDPRRHLALLLEESETFGLGVGGARTTEYHYGLIPAEGVAPQFVADGVLAVGDAAGQASLVVGEGIRISLLAGELAGETIVEALRAGRTDRAALAPYEERFRREFGRNLRIGERLNRRLAASRDDQWDERIRILQTMPASLVLDLLQSRIRVRDVLSWYVREPRQLLRSRALLAAIARR